jgi:hypothetical protein
MTKSRIDREWLTRAAAKAARVASCEPFHAGRTPLGAVTETVRNHIAPGSFIISVQTITIQRSPSSVVCSVGDVIGGLQTIHQKPPSNAAMYARQSSTELRGTNVRAVEA